MANESPPLESRLTHPRLNPSFVVVRVSENQYHIRAGPWTGPAVTITETESDGGAVGRLFERLDGETHVRDVLAEFEDDREEVAALIERLADRNILYDATDTAANYGTPQLVASPRFADTDRRRLDETTALVVATGRIGRQAASDLLASGVGEVAYARPMSDDEPTGVLADNGRLTDVRGDLSTSVDRADAVLYAADREYPAVGEELSRVAHETDTPWTLAQIRGFDGFVGPTVFPGETGCYRCLERRLLASLDDEMYAPFRQALSGTSRTPIGHPAYARAVAGMATTDFLNLLAYGQSFTAGRLLAINFFDLSVTVDDVLRLPRCPVCGKDPGKDRSRFVTTDDIVAATQHDQQEGE